MAISRMQEPRQLYGLGSLVKSIGKTIKKVVKSDLGKAAILGIGAFGLPGGALGMKGFMPANLRSLSGIGQALFTGTGLPTGPRQPGAKGFLSNLLGKVPGGGYTLGAIGSILAASGMSPEEIEATKRDPEKVKIYLRDYYSKTNPDKSAEEVEEFVTTNTSEYAVGGRVGLMGGAMPTGIMRANKAGTIERDYRETGGFVPVGIKEKADDVPAMLSKNEFVMTADAVRGIGDGNIEKGAQRLYDQMKTAEKRVV
jgi:hypothetical protein